MADGRDRYAGLGARLQARVGREDVATELEHHLEMRIEEYRAAGLSPGRAREEALKRMGDMARYAQEAYAIEARTTRRRRRREAAADATREAVRGIRVMWRSPAFALAAVLVLGLGMGATAAMYGLVDTIVLRPLPYADSDELVWVSSSVSGPGVSGEWGLSEAGYHEYRAENRSLSGLGAYSRFWGALTGDGTDAERVPLVRLTAGVLGVLGARPAVGRLIGEADDQVGAAEVVMLSHSIWRRRYGGDPGVVGRSITLDNRQVEVIGVLAEGFGLPEGQADVWMPARLDPTRRPVNAHYLSAVARLGPGETAETARRDLAMLTARFTDRFPEAYSPAFMNDYHFAVNVTSLRGHVLGSTSRMLWALLGGVFLLLVIAATNVANLFLVRAEVRQREMSVRSALGAKRWHLVWQAMTESLAISLVSGGLAVLLAWGALRLVPVLGPADLPRLEEVGLSTGALALVALFSILVAGLFSLAPLLRESDAGKVINEAGRGGMVSHRQHRVRRILVVSQVALAVVLLSGAGLMLRSVAQLRSIDPGFEPQDVTAMSISLPFAQYQGWDEVNLFHRNLLDRINAVPGVAGAAITSVLPIRESGYCALVFAEGRPVPQGEEPPCVAVALVSPGYFDVMGIELEGAAPTWIDNDRMTGAVVVSRSLAGRFWQDANVIGRGVRPNGEGPPYYRIAGVTADVLAEGLDAPPSEVVYYPLRPIPDGPLWAPPRDVSLVVRTAGPGPAVIPAIRSILRDLDPTVPLANVTAMETVVADSMSRRSFAMLLLTIAAVMALVLSAVGIYGVVAYIVGQRKGEIGVRIALGAATRQVRGQVLGQSLVMGGVGIAMGLLVAGFVNRALGTLLFDVEPADPLTLVAAALGMLAMVAVAGWGPARRASRVDPMEALRPD